MVHDRAGRGHQETARQGRLGRLQGRPVRGQRGLRHRRPGRRQGAGPAAGEDEHLRRGRAPGPSDRLQRRPAPGHAPDRSEARPAAGAASPRSASAAARGSPWPSRWSAEPAALPGENQMSSTDTKYQSEPQRGGRPGRRDGLVLDPVAGAVQPGDPGAAGGDADRRSTRSSSSAAGWTRSPAVSKTSCDTPAFLEIIKNNLKAVTDLKGMQDQIIEDTARQFGMPLAEGHHRPVRATAQHRADHPQPADKPSRSGSRPSRLEALNGLDRFNPSCFRSESMI